MEVIIPNKIKVAWLLAVSPFVRINLTVSSKWKLLILLFPIVNIDQSGLFFYEAKLCVRVSHDEKN